MVGLLEKAGCVWVDYLAAAPPTLTDRTPRPGDEDLQFVTGRRPVVEAVLAELAGTEPGVEVRRGTKVAAVATGASALGGVPHVTGVVTTVGEMLPADLVVDATGRRTRAASWLAAVGARPPREESEDRGFVYYTRFFRGDSPPRLRGRAITPMGSISLPSSGTPTTSCRRRPGRTGPGSWSCSRPEAECAVPVPWRATASRSTTCSLLPAR
ncbi:hypothetical protein LWC35_24915 [Pseudonocardia kujensis]|uniref:NAD(P)/FAD-dependent oxidoreductase n=1 Tax=Pseudonocardia kujensis TaxID=1128675 RepID=UPI001E419D08|nr:hypothetical protein [Pseudonocardia kujensis]MCE0766119.1 hypothetical protein [Pseudonocardia kujensis]